MSSADEQKAISGSSAGRNFIRLDESATSAKVDSEMPAAHNTDPGKKFHGDLNEDKQILEKLEGLESSCNNRCATCNNCKKMVEEYQKKVEELSAENETLKRTIKLMSGGADAFQTSERSDENQVSGVEFLDLKTIFLEDAEITDLPPFLRTEEVKLEKRYLKGEEFQEHMPLFHQLKPALIGSKLILGTIGEDNRECVKEKLLPFFDCCKRYQFNIEHKQKDMSAFIASLLQLPSLESSVEIEFNDNYWSFHQPEPGDATSSLPIEAILTWLHKPSAVKSNKTIGKKRSLCIYLWNIENMSEMVEHLKKAFKSAQTSVVPFRIHLSRGPFSGGPIEDEKIVNHFSLEELSIYRYEIRSDRVSVTIERGRIKDENGIKKGKKR